MEIPHGVSFQISRTRYIVNQFYTFLLEPFFWKVEDWIQSRDRVNKRGGADVILQWSLSLQQQASKQASQGRHQPTNQRIYINNGKNQERRLEEEEERGVNRLNTPDMPVRPSPEQPDLKPVKKFKTKKKKRNI